MYKQLVRKTRLTWVGNGGEQKKKLCIIYRTSEQGWDMHMISHSNDHPHLQFVASSLCQNFYIHIHLGSENEGSPRYLKSKLQCY